MNLFLKTKKLLMAILLLSIIAFGLSYIGGISIQENINTASADSTEDPVYVSIKPYESINGEAFPVVTSNGCSKKVNVLIKLSKASSENISVHYRTYDGTAAATASDYTHVDDKYIFKPGETQKIISIDVGVDKYPTKVKNDTGKGWTGRFFYVQVYQIDDLVNEIDYANSEVVCHIAYSYMYQRELVNSSKNAYSLEYTKGNIVTKDKGGSYWGKDKYVTVTDTPCSGLDSNYRTYYHNKLCGTYISTTFTAWCGDNIQKDGFISFYDGSSELVNCHLDGPWAGVKFITGDCDIKCDFRHADGRNILDESNDDISDNLEGYSYRKKAKLSYGGDNVVWIDGKMYYSINDPSDTIKLQLYRNTTNYYMDGTGFKNIKWYYTCYDNATPYIIQYYLTDQCYNLNHKIRIAVRFSEPVQVIENKKPGLYCDVNGKDGTYHANFEYVAGSGSDTLLFEYNLDDFTGSIEINSFVPRKITDSKYIVDISGALNSIGDFSNGLGIYEVINNNVNGKNLYTHIDTRSPVFTSISSNAACLNEHNVKISLDNFDTKTGKVYYSWSNDCTLTDKIERLSAYKSQAVLTSSTYTITNNTLTGARFLWIKAVSKLGKATYKIAGPYFFDNVAETATLEYIDDPLAPQRDKDIKITIDYSDSYYSQSTLEKIELVWSMDEVWTENTTYHYNDDAGVKFWTSALMGRQVDIKYEYTKLPELKWASFDSQELGTDGKYFTYSRTNFEKTNGTANKDKEYVTKMIMTIKVEAQFVGITESTKTQKSNCEYRKFYMGLKLTDFMGNSKKPGYYDRNTSLFYLDARNIFPGDWSIDSALSPTIEDENENIYLSKNFKFTFKATGDDASIAADSYNVNIWKYDEVGDETDRFTAEGKLKAEKISEMFDVKLTNSKTLTFTVKGDTDEYAGYYEVQLEFPALLAQDTKYSVYFTFFLTNSGGNGTYTNKTHNLDSLTNTKYLINKVYTISTDTTFYYRDESNYVQKQKYSESTPLSFSSESACRQYLTYLEYQDLYLIKINDKMIASNLNNNASGYYKAVEFVTRTAEIGDYWIRYKTSTWVSGGSSDGAWRYYYYGQSAEGGRLDLSSLPNALENAIDNVVTNIMRDYGSWEYLNSSFGLDKNGSPKLNPTSIKAEAQKVNASKSGTEYAEANQYGGDPGIYSNNITVEGVGDFPMGSTFELEYSEHNIIWIAKYKGQTVSESDYVKINPNDGSLLLKHIAKESGVYRIREVDENGAKTYDVYIDADAPTMSLTYVIKEQELDVDGNIVYDSKGNKIFKEVSKTVYTDSSNSSYSYYGVSCTLNGITDEMDDLAYVLIWNQSPTTVYAEYTRAELNNKTVTLGNGKYNVEVYDRSGNNYIISLFLNNTDLQCSIKEVKNSSITFKVEGRTKNDINRYEVTWGNSNMDSVFEESKKFTQAGTYHFYVEDWYGNIYEETFEFIRETPSLTWRFLTEEGYVTYNPLTHDQMKITSEGASVYSIMSSSKIGFLYDSIYNLTVEITSGSVKASQKTYGSNFMSCDFDLFTDFSFRVYYTDAPTIYADYNVIADGRAPDIICLYQQVEVYNYETYNITQIVNNSIGLKEGTEIIPDTIKYRVADASDKMISNNGIITTNAVKISADDSSGLKLLKVYISYYKDGILQDPIKELETTDAQNAVYTFEEFGKYTIEATDYLGNKAILTFTNTNESNFYYEVDGTQVKVPISCSEYFDYTNDPMDSKSQYADFTQNDFTKQEYGNSSAVYTVPTDAYISMLINTQSEKLFISYQYENGILNRRKYKIEYNYDAPQYDENKVIIAEFTPEANLEVSSTNLLSTNWLVNYEKIKNNTLSVAEQEVYAKIIEGKATESEIESLKTLKVDEWVQIANVASDGVDIYGKFDKNKLLYIRIEASNFESDILDCQIKVETQDKNEPFFEEVVLSKMKSDIKLENEEEVIETNTVGNPIYTNGIIKIDQEHVDRSMVKEVKISYSEVNKFKDFTNIYVNGEFVPYTLDREGFYQIRIINKFNNETIYNIALSNKCMIISQMIYRDGTTVDYSSLYEINDLYSNYKAIFEVYSEGFTYSTLKDGVTFTPNVTEGESFIKIEIEGDGYYSLLIRDQFGNHFEKNLEIEYKVLSVGDNLVTGFNEKALLLKDGYTNRKLSIDKAELSLTTFDLIYIYKGEELVDIVYDMNSENKVELDDAKLIECIGAQGDGDYSVKFRDKYGNVALAEYHYSATPTLEIRRQSRTDYSPSEYSLEKALEIGVYSNNIVTLLSNSICYTFTVDGVQNTFPTRFEFVNVSITEGTRDFSVYYLDEYGNEYIIDIHLLRTNINYNTPEFNIVNINDRQFTQDNIVLTYADEYTCSYVLDGSETAVDYKSGDIANQDGHYVFTLLDIAGNVQYFDIEKDTIVHYTFTGQTTEQIFESSWVAMNEKVTFNPTNSDSSKITQIYLDGILQEGVTSNVFEKNGKWEFEIKDDIGNVSIFVLYIINHEMNQFAYTCPKNYQITDVRYDSGNGQKLDYLPQVQNYQSFSFNEEGSYVVTMKSLVNNEVTKFQFIISLKAPGAALEGATDGEATIENVTLKDTKKGDEITIYKDGKYLDTFVCNNDGETPTISEQGKYKLVIKNLAGNTTTYEFTRKFVPNTASSALLIIALVVVACGLFIAVVYRNKSKVDK